MGQHFNKSPFIVTNEWKKIQKSNIIIGMSKENSKTKRAILIVGLLCILSLGVMVFVEGPGVITKKVTGLEVEQDGYSFRISWDEMDCEGYDVKIIDQGKIHSVPYLKTCNYTMEQASLGKTYTITVSARLKSGHSSRKAKEDFTMEKFSQEIEVSKESIEGFPKDKFTIEAKAEGDISFTSEKNSIASVDSKGNVVLKKPGETTITVRAGETRTYAPENRKIEIISYPDSLEKPEKISKEDITDTRTELTWSEVRYAKSYNIFKKNKATGKYKKIGSTESNSIEITRDIGKYAVSGQAEVKGKTLSGSRSDDIEVTGVAETASSYSSGKNIRVLDRSNLEVVREIHGDGDTRTPQSLSMRDGKYVVSYVNLAGTVGKFISYNKDGSLADITPASGMGHANGTTYDPNKDTFYVVKTHKAIRTASCSTYDGKTKASKGTFNLPRVTSGIAYDESNNKYYLSKGNEIYVCDSNFKVEKFIHKFVRYNHAQDIGAYNGVVMVCTWVNGNTSYIDLYRASDGDYLGSYDVSIGEIESVLVDDGYLVILMNTIGTSTDYIYRTKERISIP